MSNEQNEIDWILVLQEPIFASSSVVVCLDDSLNTTHTTTIGRRNVNRHITQPRITEVCKMIGSINKICWKAMLDCKLSLSKTETRDQHIADALRKLCRSTIVDFIGTPRPTYSMMTKKQHVNRLSLKLHHLGQFCFEIDIMLFSDSYILHFKTIQNVLYEKTGREIGNYATGDQHANHLNVADMVQVVVENLSPNVLALMTPAAAVSLTHSDGD
jgi:hypothetical protein